MVPPHTPKAEPAAQMGGVSGPQVRDLLLSARYRAELLTDEHGDPVVRTAMEGVQVSVVFYGCSKDTPRICQSLQFGTGFDTHGEITLRKLNEWNSSRRFLKTFLDNDNNVITALDVLIIGGVSPDNLKADFLDYDNLMGDFLKFIKWGGRQTRRAVSESEQ